MKKKYDLSKINNYHELSDHERDVFMNDYTDLRIALRSFDQAGDGNKVATDANVEKVLTLIGKLALNKQERKLTKQNLYELKINDCIRAVGVGDVNCDYTSRKELNSYIVQVANNQSPNCAFEILKLLKHIENDKSQFFQVRHNANKVTSFVNITNNELLKILCKVENNIKAIKNLVYIPY